MYIFTMPDNTVIGPFTTLEPTQGGYLADGAFLAEDLVAGGVISEVPDDYVNPATQAILDEQAKTACKQKASELLYATDWTTIADVINPVNNPYLLNQADFIVYRNTVRQLAVNPVTNPVFPTKPNEQWSS